MKKVYITSIISIMSVVNAFASGITAGTENPGCTEPVLGVYSGTTNLQANYNPNIIKLEWYDGENKIEPTNTTANKCTYDLNVIIPENEPTKDGYTFAGWRLRESFSISLVEQNIETNGNIYRGHGTTCFSGKSYGSSIVECDTMSDLDFREWSAEFTYGTFKGTSVCAATQLMSSGEIGNPEGTGGYCWCNVTGFDKNKDGEYVPITSNTWVSAYNNGNFKESSCDYSCASHCGGEFLRSSRIRGLHFGLTQE